MGPISAKDRSKKAYHLRKKTAKIYKELARVHHQCNGDEFNFRNKIGSFSKALPHNSLGEVDLKAYKTYIKALKSSNPDDFEAIPLGGVVKLANPQASFVYDLIGADCHQLGLPSPPVFSSSWEASEMVELLWRALTRDIHFGEYATHRSTREAAKELSSLSDFRGPKVKGNVTTRTLFRGDTPGDLVGPYVSQFLYKDIPFGATTLPQRYRSTCKGSDYMTSYEEWLNIQNGGTFAEPNFDSTPRYIRNGRDLGEYVHYDFSYQGPLSACLILNQFGREALCPNNPYINSASQGGFITFGAPHILDLIAKVTRVALEAAWFHKFSVHCRLRPEEFGGRVHNHLTNAANYPIHEELLHSKAIAKVFKKYGTYLLPMSYPEGCPTHPAYPAGHACIAGAGVTVLKAYFNEEFVIPNPVSASMDGLKLVPYSGTSLTIGGELNKLASNISFGRDMAGVHWRTDGVEGMRLGEAVAIEVLKDYRKTYNEKFSGFTLTKFDGTVITIE
ncbi:phosphoesterase [Anaerobacillus alkalilacustris]|uniref:Phosphoesterase n=1 Tax=Anaerobacillus alkalilacustris TaxID=393763 RepID=A0A1S2LGI1_9BACI|nr:vanadium-dependent haloperoxidase [Anaerobacillus alkalilacustris]OIJ11476.1 phosphoesterase [Anaerobacillus alkalilacustris]